MRRLMLYDRLGNPLGELAEADVFEATLREEINGEHSLTIATTRVLDKGIRMLYKDGRSKWREFAVAGVDAEHASGNRAIGTYYCVWSVQQDLQGVTVSVMPGVQSPVSAGTALDALLSTTERWARGTVTQMTTGGASMYDRSAWEALSVLVSVWGGEIDAAINVGTQSGVTSREVDLYAAQGNQTAMRRFDFGADLRSVKRTLADEPLFCRISPRGKGEQTDAGGYGRKITIESVNDGKDWLEYAPMVDAAKLPYGNGGYEYPTLIVENSDCETPTDLKSWAQGVLAQYCTPKVTYEVDVVQAGVEGVDVTGVSLGDAVQVVDRKFGGDGVRVQGRVRSITTDLLNERDIKIVIGDSKESISSKFASVDKSLAAVNNDLTVMSTAEYITNLLDRINTEINATGGYTYITDGQGIRTYDTAVSDPLIGSEASSVVEIKGGTIRIANSRTAQGDWEWKTVFTSGHIAANLVTASNIVTGYIGSAGSTFIDLDNNTVNLGEQSDGHVVVSTDGFQVLDGSVSVCKFGTDSSSNSYARVGSQDSGNGNVEIKKGSTSDSMSIALNNGTDALATINYGLVHKYGTSSVWRGSFFTFGYRNSDGSYYPGDNSFAMGEGCIARGVDSYSGGYQSKSLADYSFAHGYQSMVEMVNNSTLCGAAIGEGLRVSGRYLACGTYNSYNNSTMRTYARFVVGGGYDSVRSNAMVVYDDGDTVISGSLTQSSDKRLKNHIEYLADDAVEFVQGLKPVLFSMKSSGKRRLGFYAQDVRDAEPAEWATDTVSENGMDDSMPDMLTLDYTALIAPLVAYAQSLESRIADLEKRIGELERGRC